LPKILLNKIIKLNYWIEEDGYMLKNKKGSQWRKWDLHLHTCYSWLNNEFSNKENGEKDEEMFIEKIVNSDVEAIGLTNYFNFNEKDYQLKEKLENNGIITFLNLELRLKNVNKEGDLFDYHIIFSNELDNKVIKNFLVKLTVGLGDKETSAYNLTSKADVDKAYVSFDTVIDTLQDSSLELEGKYMTGFLTRGKGSVTNKKGSKKAEGIYEEITRKSDFIIHSSDKNSNKAGDRNFWLNNKYIRPLLIGSDAHKLEDIGTKFSWIKSDLSFVGLKQIMYEPEHRISLNLENPDTKSDYLVIDKIKVDDKYIYLNENLNTIIGGRSTGKSTLMNSIAKHCDSENFDENNMNVFDKSISITWKDNKSEDNRYVEFIPQEYMVNIARNIEKFDELIINIIKNKGLDQEINDYKQTITTIKEKMYEYLNEYNRLKKSLQSLIRPEGDLEGIRQQLKSLETAEENFKINAQLNSKEWNEYLELEENIINMKKEQSDLSKDFKELEYLLNISVLKNISIENLSESSYQYIQNLHNKLNKRVSKYWQRKIEEMINCLKMKCSDLEISINEIRNTNIYKKGKEQIDKNEELSIITKKKEIENENLQKFNKYKDDKDKIENKISELQIKIISTFKEFKEAKIKLESDFVIEEKDLKIEIKFYQKSIEEEIIYLNKNNIFNRDFIEKFEDNLEESIKTLFTNPNFKFNKNKENSDFIYDVFLNNWYDFNFSITYQNDEFQKMSQGKKSFVILKLLLEFSNNKKPVLIDQPEDSLDNRAIYNDLTSYLIEKKKERQIILVSHNPNIVVGADAENVIVANQHSELTPNEGQILFDYVNGSLENSHDKNESINFTLQKQGIREHVYEILEGGEDAFKKRENRYKS
jgi:predicted ATPase